MSPLAHRVQRGLGDRLAAAGSGLAVDAHVAGQIEEPLVRQHRLDDRVRALADRHLQLVLLRLDQKAGRVEIGEHGLARGEAIHAAIFFRRVVVDLRVERQDHARRELVARADLPVVEIVRRRDLDRAGAEFAIDVFIGDDRNLAAGQWQRQHLADQRLIALVFRMHRDGDVAEHRLRTRRRDDDAFAAIARRIADRPQRAIAFLVVDFEVGHGRHQHRIPVHEPLAAIEQAGAIPLDEHAAHRGREALVHREAFARPVDRRAEPAHLVGDRRARFFLPFPHALDEFRAAEIVARLAFGGELVLDDLLRRDAGVIGAALPERA